MSKREVTRVGKHKVIKRPYWDDFSRRYNEDLFITFLSRCHYVQTALISLYEK